MEIITLIDKCIKSAIEYGTTAFEIVENSKTTNRLYERNFKNFKSLKAFGNDGIKELEKLLEHPNDYVKYSSATHLLSVKEDKSKKILQQLASKPELFGFSVQMLLEEWENGNLKDYLR